MKFSALFSRRRPRARGFTLIEYLVSVTLTTLVLGTPVLTFVMITKEQFRSISDVRLSHEASMLQESVIRVLRSMSGTESVAFGDATATGSGLYRRMVVAQGPAADYPREEIYFDNSSQQLMHTPNRGTIPATPIFSVDAAVGLRNVYFFSSLKSGVVPDGSMLNVYVEMDDRGGSSRRLADGTPKTNVLRRTFSVKMRNP